MKWFKRLFKNRIRLISFSSKSGYSLSEEIENWLKNKKVKIISMSFCYKYDGSGYQNNSCFNALIIYKE